MRTEGALRTAFLDIIGLLLNRTLVKKVGLALGQKDDVLIFLAAILNPAVGDSPGSIGETTPERSKIRARINNFRSRFAASIAAGDGQARWGVYLHILGKLYAAGMRVLNPGSFTADGASKVTASKYGHALLKSLRAQAAEAGVLEHAAEDGSAAAPNPKTTKAARAKSGPGAANVPLASTIREIADDDAASELLRTSWWPEEMRLLWIYAEEAAYKDLVTGWGKPGHKMSRDSFTEWMYDFPDPKKVRGDHETNEEAQNNANRALRRMIGLDSDKKRFPKTIVFYLPPRNVPAIVEEREEWDPARGPEPRRAEVAEEHIGLAGAIEKLEKWIRRLATKARSICVVVISGNSADSKHAMITLVDRPVTSVPSVTAFMSDTFMRDRAKRPLKNVGASDDGEDATLATALELAALPLDDEMYEPVRWTAGGGRAAPSWLRLVGAGEQAQTLPHKYPPKEMRVFVEQAGTVLPIVPHVALTDKNAGRFVRFLEGRADHASHVRVIDATALTMPDGKATPTPATRAHDLNVALLLAVAMDTPSVLIVTPKQSERMMLELEWMDRVFLRPAAAGNVGGQGAGKVSGSPAHKSSSASPTGGGDSSVVRKASTVSASLSDEAVQGSLGSNQGPDHADLGADHGDGPGEASVATGGKARAGDDGKFEIFGESLCIVNHDNGGTKKCSPNMLKAAADHKARLAEKGLGDKLEFLVSTRPCAVGKGTPRHHSATPQNEGSIYIRCAPDATDDALELDYPDGSSAIRTVISGSGSQGEIAKKVNEAMDKNTKIYIVCTERPESAAADV